MKSVFDKNFDETKQEFSETKNNENINYDYSSKSLLHK